MIWARIGRAAALAALGATATLAAGSVGPAATATQAKPPRPLISVGQFRASVSPNGDGFHDRLRIPFTVRRWASVSARVVNVDTARTVYNGCVTTRRHDCEFGPGEYALRLADLQRAGHRRWEPGTYRVRLVARSYAGLESHRAHASFELFPGTVRAERHRIRFSPGGDGVRNRARIVFTLERRARVAAFLHPRSPGAPAGVVRLGVRGRGTGSWVWDGRVGGAIVPAGRYRLELRARPVAGKHRVRGTDAVTLRVRPARRAYGRAGAR